jgi:hypothetical protein
VAVLLLLGCSDHTLTGKVSEPAVTITSPGEDATFAAGEEVTFVATAGGGDGDGIGFGWFWSAGSLGDLDGEQTVVDDTCTIAATFPEGDWTVQVLVTDLDSRSAGDTVDIHVLPPEPPVVDLAVGDPSCDAATTFTVTASDPDSDLATLSLAWDGLPDGVEGPTTLDPDGTATLDAVLGEGTWEVSVTATDPTGEVGSDAVVVVLACVSDLCDGVDDDGDGAIDEDAATSTWYADADGDGYGDPGVAVKACAAPDGTVANADDCDDEDEGVHPGATEACNGVDDDCDGEIDEDASGGAVFGMPASGELYEAALDGSGVTRLATGLGSVSDLDIDGDAAWVGAWSAPVVTRVELDGSGTTTIYNGAGAGGQGVAVDDATGALFYGEYYGDLSTGASDGSVGASALVSRSAIEALIGGYDGIGVGLEYDVTTGYVYFFTRSNGGSSGRHILRVLDDGSGLEDLRQIESMCMELDAAGGWLYFADQPASTAEMWRIALDGSGEEYLFDLHDNATCSGVAVADGRIYYLQDQSGSLWSANTDGTDHVELASGYLHSQGLDLRPCE